MSNASGFFSKFMQSRGALRSDFKRATFDPTEAFAAELVTNKSVDPQCTELNAQTKSLTKAKSIHALLEIESVVVLLSSWPLKLQISNRWC